MHIPSGHSLAAMITSMTWHIPYGVPAQSLGPARFETMYSIMPCGMIHSSYWALRRAFLILDTPSMHEDVPGDSHKRICMTWQPGDGLEGSHQGLSVSQAWYLPVRMPQGAMHTVNCRLSEIKLLPQVAEKQPGLQQRLPCPTNAANVWTCARSSKILCSWHGSVWCPGQLSLRSLKCLPLCAHVLTGPRHCELLSVKDQAVAAACTKPHNAFWRVCIVLQTLSMHGDVLEALHKTCVHGMVVFKIQIGCRSGTSNVRTV